jgi:hypothetical protein
LLLFPNARHDDQVGTLACAAPEATRRRQRVDLWGSNPSELATPSPNQVDTAW